MFLSHSYTFACYCNGILYKDYQELVYTYSERTSTKDRYLKDHYYNLINIGSFISSSHFRTKNFSYVFYRCGLLQNVEVSLGDFVSPCSSTGDVTGAAGEPLTFSRASVTGCVVKVNRRLIG